MLAQTSPRAAAAPVDADRRDSRFRLAAGGLMLAATLLTFFGISWDVEWHDKVGPDSFWTAPHLALYSGTALAGLICLGAVLLTTLRFRRGDPGVTPGNTRAVLKLFRAPVGFLLGGLGAAAFLLYGGFDLYWHSIFGFDVTLASPPHVGLLLSVMASGFGGIVVFAAEANRARRRDGGEAGWLQGGGVAVSIALWMGLMLFFLIALFEIDFGPFADYAVTGAVFYPLALLLAASVVRRPGIATLVGVSYTLLRLLAWFAVPAVTSIQVGAEGLAFRDFSSQLPSAASFMPGGLIVAGLLVDGLLYVARSRRLSVTWSVLATALIAGTVNFWLFNPLRLLAGDPSVLPERRESLLRFIEASATPSLLLTLALAPLCGWLGWRLGAMLRHTEG
ncbi:MAG TPA: hypothetical protein VGE07_08075 [Herpetosiphonaceae bacterium]